jgi:hypothetical protein
MEDAMVEIRKLITMREMVSRNSGSQRHGQLWRAVGMAVILNPFAGRFVDDPRQLFEAGAELGERLMPALVKLLDGPAVSYGKGAIGGGKAVVCSNVKVVAAAGASLDVPLGHKSLQATAPAKCTQ